jgi:hypothetical protein
MKWQFWKSSDHESPGELATCDIWRIRVISRSWLQNQA